MKHQPQDGSLSRVQRRRIALPGRDIEMALLDWGGDGPLVLMHHATGFCGATLGILAERLSTKYRVLVLDARGHGDSTVPEASSENYHWNQFGEDLVILARALLKELGQDSIHLGVGHSFGGTATLFAAELDPSLFKRIAMLDPVIFLPEREEPDSGPIKKGPGNYAAEGARRRRGVWPSRDAIRSSWRAKKFFQVWDPRVLELYIEEGFHTRSDGQVELKCSPEVEATVFEMTGSSDVFAKAKDVGVPVLILHADKGHFSMEVYEKLAGLMPKAHVEGFPSGHLIPIEAPDQVADRLLRFAQESL